MLVAGFAVHADTYLFEVQFSTNPDDLASIQVEDNKQAHKNFEDSVRFKEKDIGIGTEVIVSKCIPKNSGEIDLIFSTTKRFVSEWKNLSDGSQMPYFKLQELKDMKISISDGMWIEMGKLPGQDPIKIRITKK